ncbi:cob(I)yrinic acid a,c-diamide adenosyltransferase, partial [bacterium]|nr:cob(I)yrinic acid a,c-diamide adenosyltransferase [bacterium]
LDLKEVVEKIKGKPDNVEVVITGRRAPEGIIEIADLVTEMKEVKHPYQKGVEARRGIEY